MGLICTVIRFLRNVITGIFSTLFGKLAGSGFTPMEITESSRTQIPVGIRRTQVIEVEFHDRVSDVCAAVFDKEKDGRLACAIVYERGKNPDFWRALTYIASELAIDPMKRPCETVKWVLVLYTVERRAEFSFEVWEVLLWRDEDGSLRASWSEARAEYATEWIHRVEATMELAPRIRIRPSTSNGRVRVA